MKKIITIAILVASLAGTAFAQTAPKTTIVQAQGQVLKLSQNDVKYVITKLNPKRDASLIAQLKSDTAPQTIRFNESADLIILIIKARVTTGTILASNSHK